MSIAIPSMHPETVERYPPGDLAVWIFILAELLVFALFFTACAFARLQDVALFNEFQQHLDRCSAFINTLALITGSYFVVRAVAAIRDDDRRACVRWLLASLVMGGLFLFVKSVEYAHHYEQGVTLSTNTFLYVLPFVDLFSFHACHYGRGLWV